MGDEFTYIPHAHQLGADFEGLIFLEERQDGKFQLLRVDDPSIKYALNKGQFCAHDGQKYHTNPSSLYEIIEQYTDRPRQEHALNSIELSINSWLEEVMKITTTNEVLIEFSFDNIVVVSSEEVEFDIMAKANIDGIRFAASDVYLTYSTTAFGENVVENEKIEATKEVITENDVYTLELSDVSSSLLKFLVDSGFEPDELYPLAQVEEKFLHVKIDIENIYELASISFDGFNMSDQSFFYDSETGEYIDFDRIVINDPIFPFGGPQIDDFPEDYDRPAGTRLEEDVLVISGTNLGNHNNAEGEYDITSCLDCRVKFVNSDNPFDNVYAKKSDIISWSNEEIQLNIPSATATTSLFGASAMSGDLSVETADGESNDIDIYIPYSVLNFQASVEAIGPAKRFASSAQTQDGIIFQYHSSVVSSGKKAIFDDAFEAWCEKTSIAWRVNSEILDEGTFESLLDGNDGRNIISEQPDNAFPSSSARAFVTINGHFNFFDCEGEAPVVITDVDVAVKMGSVNSNDSYRWYNFALHELGHAHLLQHCNDDDNFTFNNPIMYYDITILNASGNDQEIDDVIAEGANTIFTASGNLLASCDELEPIFTIDDCGSTTNSHFIPKSISNILIYPNPGTYKDQLSVLLTMTKQEEVDLELFSLFGNGLTSIQSFDCVEGENTVILNQTSKLPIGVYILRVGIGNNSFYTKYIKS